MTALARARPGKSPRPCEKGLDHTWASAIHTEDPRAGQRAMHPITRKHGLQHQAPLFVCLSALGRKVP